MFSTEIHIRGFNFTIVIGLLADMELWVTVHVCTGGGWAPDLSWHPIFNGKFYFFFHRRRMAAAVPTTKTSMFAMSAERKTLLDNRMAAQYPKVTVIDDDEFKWENRRIAPTLVRSARWLQAEMGQTAAFPITVDEQNWRAYIY